MEKIRVKKQKLTVSVGMGAGGSTAGTKEGRASRAWETILPLGSQVILDDIRTLCRRQREAALCCAVD